MFYLLLWVTSQPSRRRKDKEDAGSLGSESLSDAAEGSPKNSPPLFSHSGGFLLASWFWPEWRIGCDIYVSSLQWHALFVSISFSLTCEASLQVRWDPPARCTWFISRAAMLSPCTLSLLGTSSFYRSVCIHPSALLGLPCSPGFPSYLQELRYLSSGVLNSDEHGLSPCPLELQSR